jgi:hypothetical protein
METVWRPLPAVVTVVCVPPSGTMPGAAPAFACVAPANSSANSARRAVWPAVRPAHAAGNALDSTVSPVNPARCIRNFIGLFRRCCYAAFVGGLELGFFIGLVISVRHDMDRTAMADTPRNSAADRIKNSTDDSILKSYRECLWAMGRPSIPCAQPAGERKDKGVVQPRARPAALRFQGKQRHPMSKACTFLIY